MSLSIPIQSRGGAGVASAAAKECARFANLFCLDANLNVRWALASGVSGAFPDPATVGFGRPTYNASLDQVEAVGGGVFSSTNRADYEKNVSSFTASMGSTSLLNDDGSVVAIGSTTIKKFSAAGSLLFSDTLGVGVFLDRVFPFAGGYAVAANTRVRGYDTSLSPTFVGVDALSMADFTVIGSNFYVAGPSSGGFNARKLDATGATVASGSVDGTSPLRLVIVATDGTLYWSSSTPGRIVHTNASLATLNTIDIPVVNGITDIAAAPSGGVYASGSFSSAAYQPNNLFHYNASGTLLKSTRIGYSGPSATLTGETQNLFLTSKPDGSRLFAGGLARYYNWQASL